MTDRGDSPHTPATPADILRALGPDYQEALANAIAGRLDELARQRAAVADTPPGVAQEMPRRQAARIRLGRTLAIAGHMDAVAWRTTRISLRRGRVRLGRLRNIALLACVPIAFGAALLVHSATAAPSATNTVQLHQRSPAVGKELLAFRSCMASRGYPIVVSYSPVWGYQFTYEYQQRGLHAADVVCGAPGTQIYGQPNS